MNLNSVSIFLLQDHFTINTTMGISDFSLSRYTLRFLIVWRYGHQP
jgi:hypothetical protein